MAVDRVEQRLRRVTAALESAGIPYAVVDGNAVAALPEVLRQRLANIEREPDL